MKLSSNPSSPQIPASLRSITPFTVLSAGYLGPHFVHIIGHDDGKVSFVPAVDFNAAHTICGISSQVAVRHLVALHITEIAFPTAGVIQRVPVRSYADIFAANTSASIRLAHDRTTGVWIVCSDPVVTSHTPQSFGLVSSPAILPTRGGLFPTMESFQAAAVEAVKNKV